MQICKRRKSEKNLMIFKVKNPPSSSNLSPRKESKTRQADIEFYRSQKHVRQTCNFQIINLSETLKFMNFVTWWIIPSTPDLFHVVCNIKVVITSQDSYASPSSKIKGFAVNNFGFLGILQKMQIKTTSLVSYTQLNSSTRSDNK